MEIFVVKSRARIKISKITPHTQSDNDANPLWNKTNITELKVAIQTEVSLTNQKIRSEDGKLIKEHRRKNDGSIIARNFIGRHWKILIQLQTGKRNPPMR